MARRPKPVITPKPKKVKTEYLMGRLSCGCIRSLTMPEVHAGEGGCIGRHNEEKEKYQVLWTSLRSYEGDKPHFRSHRCGEPYPTAYLSTPSLMKEMVHV